MGKRELLIIVAFVAIGAVAFELTAPPAPEGRSFSLSRWWQSARRGMRGNQAIASSTQRGEIELNDSVSELRVGGLNRGVRIVGDDRKNIAWELHVESNGPDDATALAWSKKAKLKLDDLGSSLSVSVSFPSEGTQWGALILKVPARLALKISGGSGGADVTEVAAVDFDRVSGTITIKDIAGAATGTQTNGELTIDGAAAVDMTLTNTRAKITDVRKSVVLNARNGRCEIADVAGSVEIDQSNQETTVEAPGGPVRVAGTGGHLTIEHPQKEVKVDCRRAEVEVTIDESVPMTLLTTDETLRLMLDGPPAISMDAVATEGGSIRAEDFDLPIKSVEGEQRCSKVFGDGGSPPRVTLRAVRGSIVIRKAK
jgi:acetolactate synthase regulatory subunit